MFCLQMADEWTDIHEVFVQDAPDRGGEVAGDIERDEGSPRALVVLYHGAEPALVDEDVALGAARVADLHRQDLRAAGWLAPGLMDDE